MQHEETARRSKTESFHKKKEIVEPSKVNIEEVKRKRRYKNLFQTILTEYRAVYVAIQVQQQIH